MSPQLQDKVAIVTGSSSGIGEAIAIKFASHGAKVTLCGRDQERLKKALDKVVQASGGDKDRFLTVQGDLNDSAVRKAIIDQTVETFGRLDILVANAGVIQSNDSISNATEDSYDAIMNTNLKSVFFLIQQAVPHLEKSKGNIVNISSDATTIILPESTVYSMSKAALDHLTRCLAVDLGSRGIRVNVVNPGFVPTRISRNHQGDIDTFNSQVGKATGDRCVLKDGPLTAENVAEAVVFLASDVRGGFVTGESIHVDAGLRFSGVLRFSEVFLLSGDSL